MDIYMILYSRMEIDCKADVDFFKETKKKIKIKSWYEALAFFSEFSFGK
jgi:hypothetical protein